jgi:hypothetical protein
MTPAIIAALLGGFALGGLLRRAETLAARRRARQWRWSSRAWQAEAADAYREVAFLAERNEELHKHLGAAFDVGFDHGWQNAAGIRVDLGGIEP